ncbi:hypothetical protein [Desulfoplanes formicivorans]|uniref:Uncharacterized protein n=1 Tax=Desulfoplanes formicivorans TaxID=1592317 RepID=A0A194AEV8_9BACT|nr:hypothetical protein [Desulfoplanes formicivorans]GAU07863.1 hypothetical protein DPF_0562 [Desulfoplanes formicivorans]
MFILYSCLIVLAFGIVDAIIFKYIQTWESRSLAKIRNKDDQLTKTYQAMVKETQQIKAKAEALRLERQANEQVPSSKAPRAIAQPRQNIALQLVQQGLVSGKQLNKAKQYQKSTATGKPLEEILVLLGSLEQETLDEFLRSQQAGMVNTA